MGVSDRIWTPARARAEGVSERDLTGGRHFVRVMRGYYVEPCWADDLLTRCAVLTTAVPGSVVSHWTALTLWGLPTPHRTARTVHLSVTDPVRHRIAGAVVHRAGLQPAAVPGSIVPLSGPGWAWCDAAALMAGPRRWSGHREAEVLGDLVVPLDALLRQRPRVRRHIVRFLASRAGCRGVATARRALDLADPAAESPRESRLRVLLVLAGLRPVVQHEVRDGDGQFVARVDLAFVQQKVAVEYDGDHHRSREQWVADLRRRERLESLGWRVVVVTAADLRDPLGLVDRVRQALGRSG